MLTPPRPRGLGHDWPTLSGLKNSGSGVEPAMRPRNREIWAGLPSRAVTRPSISAVGGSAMLARPRVNSYIGKAAASRACW